MNIFSRLRDEKKAFGIDSDETPMLVTDTVLEMAFKEADQDNNGSLDYEEFMHIFRWSSSSSLLLKEQKQKEQEQQEQQEEQRKKEDKIQLKAMGEFNFF